MLELESWVPHDLNGVVHKSGGPWTIAWQRSVFVASGIPSGNRELTLSARASKVGLSVSSFQGNINKLADKHEIYIYIHSNKPTNHSNYYPWSSCFFWIRWMSTNQQTYLKPCNLTMVGRQIGWPRGQPVATPTR